METYTIFMKKLLRLFLPIFVVLLFVGLPFASIAENSNNSLKNSLDKFRQSRQEFRNAKLQKTIVSEKRRDVLVRLIDIQIKYFERTKERIEKMPNITQEFKNELDAKINEVIQGLVEKKVTVESAQTPEEIKNLALEIQSSSKSYREIIKNIVNAILTSRVDRAIDKAEERLVVIDKKVQKLKKRGEDVSEVEKSIDYVGSFIENIRGGMERKTFKETLKDLKDAYQQLRSLISKVNNTK